MSDKQVAKMVWLDDNREHEEDAINLTKATKGLLDVKFLLPSDFDNFLAGKEPKEIDLYLIDDLLFKDRKNGEIKGRGFSYAAIIRENYPEVPIYLFSAMKDPNGIFGGLSQAAISLGDWMIDLKNIQRFGSSFLYSEALDYRKIRETKRQNFQALMSLLNVPELEQEKIFLALPSNLRNGLSPVNSASDDASGNAIAFSKWVRRKLLSNPGFLYNELFSATKMGISLDTFHEHEELFKEAQYCGVFSQSAPRKLWWSTALDTVLFKIAKKEFNDSSSTDLQELSRKVFNLNNRQLPKCIVCGELYPDTVGVNKITAHDWRPVHYRCSNPSAKDKRELYFDEIREYKI